MMIRIRASLQRCRQPEIERNGFSRCSPSGAKVDGSLKATAARLRRRALIQPSSSRLHYYFPRPHLLPTPTCASFASGPAMRSLFHSKSPDPAPAVEPVPTVSPKFAGADIAAVFAGRRMAGDFYDSIRVSPDRVLFGLLDVAGRREDKRSLLIAAQEVFRALGAELFSRPDMNESDAMTELSLRINRSLIETSKGVHPCPAFLACYHEGFGTLCYTTAGHTPGLLRD